MSRRTSKDRAFSQAFAKKLKAAFDARVKDKRNQSRMSVKAFADSLNLTRAGLHKAMKGRSVPKLALIERARQYGVIVEYGDLPVVPRSRTKMTAKNESSAIQLFLPFSVENLKKENVRVELGDHHGDLVEVKVWIKFTA